MLDLQREIDETTSGFIRIPLDSPLRPAKCIQVHRPVVIEGCSSFNCVVESDFYIVPGIDAKLRNFRIRPPSGRSVEAGIRAGNWMRGRADDLLIENFPVGIDILAGMGWMVSHNWIVNCGIGIDVQNLINGDQGDNYIIANTIDAPEGIAGIRWRSGGGMWLAFNKFLHHDYSFLMEMQVHTSNLHGIANSFELFKHWAAVMKLEGGTFENCQWIANQLMSKTGSGFNLNGINRGVLDGTVANIPNGIARQSDNCTDWVFGDNAVRQRAEQSDTPPIKPWWMFW